MHSYDMFATCDDWCQALPECALQPASDRSAPSLRAEESTASSNFADGEDEYHGGETGGARLALSPCRLHATPRCAYQAYTRPCAV